MSVEELIKLFMEDRIEGKKEFITWFLNNVMDEEAIEQLKAERYERTDEIQKRLEAAGFKVTLHKRALKNVNDNTGFVCAEL